MKVYSLQKSSSSMVKLYSYNCCLLTYTCVCMHSFLTLNTRILYTNTQIPSSLCTIYTLICLNTSLCIPIHQYTQTCKNDYRNLDTCNVKGFSICDYKKLPFFFKNSNNKTRWFKSSSSPLEELFTRESIDIPSEYMRHLNLYLIHYKDPSLEKW